MKSTALEVILKKFNLSEEVPIEQGQWRKLLHELDEKFMHLESSVSEGHVNGVDLIHETKLSTLGKLSAFMAHELNNPLTAVLNHASLLAKRKYPEAKRQEKIESIVRQSQRMKDIIAHLTRLSNKSNSEPTKQNLISIEEPIQNAREFFIGRFEDLKVSYNFINDLPEDSTILGNSTNLESVFQNLFTNSLYSFEEKGSSDNRIEIKVTHEEKEDVISIVYKDNAMGMTNEVREKIFTPFYTTKESERGSGLGMAVISQIIKDHLGKIGCKSYYGKGTLFKIVIPLYSEKFDHSKIFDASELAIV